MNKKSLLIAIALTVPLFAACSKPPESGNTAKLSAAKDKNAPTADHGQTVEQMQPEMAQSTRTATATGTVESIDATAGKITIAHGPVASVNWPAMTMAFKATPEQIASVKPDQNVEFEFESKGMDATLTRIAPVQ